MNIPKTINLDKNFLNLADNKEYFIIVRNLILPSQILSIIKSTEKKFFVDSMKKIQ